jgi:hypothetical protein
MHPERASHRAKPPDREASLGLTLIGQVPLANFAGYQPVGRQAHNFALK